MAYFGFDLDETLGRFMAVDDSLFFIMPDVVYRGQLKSKKPFDPSPDLQAKLDFAFQAFVKCLATKERESDLRLLRPGILQIIQKLSDLKSEGRVKGIVVYSNNGNLGCLKVATGMIEELLGKPGLFCNHVDWWSPLRNGINWRGNPGQADKTTMALRKCFLDSRCGSSRNIASIPINNLYFFDDRIHPEIFRTIGADHYFNVKPYHYDASYIEITKCMTQALESANLNNDQEYLNYIAPVLSALGLTKSYENILIAVNAYNARYPPQRLPFEDDTSSILARLDTLFPPPNYSENYFPVVDGGRSTRHRKRSLKRRKVYRKRSIRSRKN